MAVYTSPISNDSLKSLCSRACKNDYIDPGDYSRFHVKRGLRNSDGTGVMAGLTKICSVEGYYISDGERVPKEGRLVYRGIDINDIISACNSEKRFGYEETAWLLIFGKLPTEGQLERFKKILADCRELPEDFIEDMIMKAPSPNIMNKMARSVMALYSYDENPDDISPENVMRQCIQLIAQLPSIMAYAYQVKRRHYYHKSMYLHPIDKNHSTAEAILNSIRADRHFTREEALLLDTCLIAHMEHGGGNNSTFATRVLTSSGTDTYSAIAAGIGSLKGPRHGGANAKVAEMVACLKANVEDITDEEQIAEFLKKLMKKQLGDGSGLVYGMGHAVYTLSDPRAKILKQRAESFSKNTEFEQEFIALSLVEKLTPIVFSQLRGVNKKMCANVDLYSGLVYKMLGIPDDLYTPLFTVARAAGWAAHRLEELTCGGKIIRPAYKSVCLPGSYVPISERVDDDMTADAYIPTAERV